MNSLITTESTIVAQVTASLFGVEGVNFITQLCEDPASLDDQLILKTATGHVSPLVLELEPDNSTVCGTGFLKTITGIEVGQYVMCYNQATGYCRVSIMDILAIANESRPFDDMVMEFILPDIEPTVDLIKTYASMLLTLYFACDVARSQEGVPDWPDIPDPPEPTQLWIYALLGRLVEVLTGICVGDISIPKPANNNRRIRSL